MGENENTRKSEVRLGEGSQWVSPISDCDPQRCVLLKLRASLGVAGVLWGGASGWEGRGVGSAAGGTSGSERRHRTLDMERNGGHMQAKGNSK